ncbi:MAG TPA: type II and III secretion system protein family protein [Sphingomicrobium sp.]|jgi:pilus assembly protein CpaC|nr:type II and III secretion system protein family protein [Sphingomicrobium sp.]
MKTRNINSRARLGTALTALAIGLTAVAAPAQAAQPKAYASGAYRPSTQVLLNVGEGQMVNLPRAVASVWTSNPKVADVYVNSKRQINLFGKDQGEATIIATAADGSVVYGAKVRVNQNISDINEILHQAMPDANLNVRTVGQVAVINGTVASPEDAAQAEMLVKAALNPGVDVSKSDATLNIVPVSRVKVATPLQVTLKVKVAEVSRDLLKQVGVNLLSRDPTSGFQFGIGQGNAGTFGSAASGTTAAVPKSFNIANAGTTLGAAGHLLGLDLLSTLNLAETDGLVTILAEPTLTALSGETASFLAGGEFPIPVSQSLGAVTIEYKQYGVGLAFTPIVLEDGRISMRVRPEVSELSDAGSVTLNNYVVPALTTRRAETTVELGSGQSFMIAGLLRNTNSNTLNKAPLLGDLPILGALFRSTKFRRQETELVIIVTPYLVRPVSGRLALPTDGYRATTDAEQVLEGQSYKGVSGPRARVPAPAPGLVTSTGATAAAPGFKL